MGVEFIIERMKELELKDLLSSDENIEYETLAMELANLLVTMG